MDYGRECVLCSYRGAIFRVSRNAAPNVVESAGQGVYTPSARGCIPLGFGGIYPFALGVYTPGARGYIPLRLGGVYPFASGVYTPQPRGSTPRSRSSSFSRIIGRLKAVRWSKIATRRNPYLHINAAFLQIWKDHPENTPIWAPFSVGLAKSRLWLAFANSLAETRQCG